MSAKNQDTLSMFASLLLAALLLQADRAPIQGRLVDRSSGVPVPEFTLEVQLRKRDPIRLVTDANGEFRTEAEFKRTRYSLALIDHERSPEPRGHDRARLTHDPAEGVNDLRIEVGPTYALDLRLPSGEPASNTTRFDAWLYHDAPLATSLPGHVKGPRAPVRGEDTRWVRFRDRHCDAQLTGGPWWLELRSLDGKLGGGARVRSLRDTENPVRIELAPRGILRGRFVDPNGKPVDEGHLRLRRLPGAEWHDLGSTNNVGEFQFLALEAGTWWLELCDPRFRGQTRELEVVGGEVLDLGEVPVEGSGSPVTQTGVITSRSVLYDAPGEIVLEALDKQLYSPPRVPLEWTTLDGGQRVAPFEFEVPEHERYRVRVYTLDHFDWGVVGELGGSEEPVRIQLDDRTRPLRLSIRDAVTGAELSEAETTVNLGLYNDWFEGALVEVEEVPLTLAPESFEWCVTAPGYAPRFGDLKSFQLDEDGEFNLELTLEQGWGNRFDVFDRRTLQPLSGVRVSLDGELVGETLAEGLFVRRDQTPKELDLTLEGWSWVGGSEEYRRLELLDEEVVPVLLWMTRDSRP